MVVELLVSGGENDPEARCRRVVVYLAGALVLQAASNKQRSDAAERRAITQILKRCSHRPAEAWPPIDPRVVLRAKRCLHVGSSRADRAREAGQRSASRF